jgi:GDP-L-fucose synthase
VAKILLTGSTGMVGRNLLEHRFARDHVWISPSRSELDLRNFSDVYQFVEYHRPDLIIHAAGRVGGIHANIGNPVEFLVDNIDLSRNVILAAKNNRVPRLINLASSCMYPRDRSLPLHETDVLTGELEPTNEGYALAKIFSLRLCQYINRSDPKLSYKTLIPCNLYGRWDDFDPSSSHLVAAAIRKVYFAKKNGESSVSIWGDGLAMREFMYAGDLAAFMQKAITSFDELPDAINVGTGIDFSVTEYYRAAAEVVGYKGNFEFEKDKPVGMQRKLLDVSRLSSLGWSPSTSLENGLKATYQFYLEKYHE